MFSRSASTLAACAVVMAVAALPAAAAGSVTTGKQIATRWCAGCHIVSADQKAANADVPSFFEIAKRPDLNGLENFLANPHPPMPDMSLTQAEIGDLLAYIASLK